MEEVLTVQYEATLEQLTRGELDGGRMRQLLEMIESVARDKDRALRPDALVFVLVNLQFMLSQPNADYARLGSPHELDHKLELAVEIIMDKLSGESPHSSHAVLRAVEDSWQELALMFGWA